MCSHSTENKQVASSSCAILGRLKYTRAALSSCLQQRVATSVAALTTSATMVSCNISSTRNKPLRWLVRSWKNHKIKNYYVNS